MAKETEPETKTERSDTISIHRNWAYGLGALLIFLVLLIIGVGIAGRHEDLREAKPLGGLSSGLAQRSHRYAMGGGGGMGMNVNSGNRVNGVVTSVNGSNFTVAGFGSTTNVTTDSSTQYQGGNAVKVNDTVVVFGTTNGGTLTATQVSINP